VRMVQCGSGLGFTFETATGGQMASVVGADEFDGDFAKKLLIFGDVDFAHSTRTEMAQNSVMRDLRAFRDLGHCFLDDTASEAKRQRRAWGYEEGDAQMTKSAMPAIAKRMAAMRKKRRSFESSSCWEGLPAILKKKRRKPAATKRRSQTGMPASSVGMERMLLYARLQMGKAKRKESGLGR